MIASDDAIAGATPLVHSKCTVIKVHGDYLDARIKNTDAELEDYSPAMNTLLDQVFDNFGLLVVGWPASGTRCCDLPSFAPLLGDTRSTGHRAATLARLRKTSYSSALVGASRSQMQTVSS